MREFFKTDAFYDFVNKNSNVGFEFYLRRGHHPFIRAMYCNGFQKDIGLRNYSAKEIFETLNKVKQNCKIIIIIKSR